MRFRKLFIQLAPIFALQLAWSSLLTPELLSQEQSFPAPPVGGILGVKDASAMTEVAGFLEASSATGWHDLEGSGTLTFPAGDEHSATLWLSGAQESRLDVVMDSGTRSSRLATTSGRFRDEKGNQTPVFPDTASRGIFAFSRIWAEGASTSQISFHDQGMLSVTGQSLHRITMEYPYVQASGFRPTVATDLYFNPTTHLLVFSVEDVRFMQVPYRLFRRVTEYSNYQTIGAITFPASIRQTLDGQVQWKLQITQITTNTNPPDSTFSF